MGDFNIKYFNKINPEEIINSIDNKEIGSNILTYEQIDSTNIKAKELASAGCPSGTVIIAEKQLSGKGRLGRAWHSPEGTGLWFSIIIRPEISPDELSLLTILSSLAVYESIMEIEKEMYCNIGIDRDKGENNIIDKKKYGIKIKWPNDVLLGGKKVSGILSEVSCSNKINYAVVGIGINVNQECFPEEIKESATSLKIYYKQDIDRIRLFKKILLYFEKYYFLLLDKKNNELLQMWKDKISIIGKEVNLYSSEKVYQGKVIDISSDGRLVIKDADGNIHRFWAGDVSLRKI